MAHSSYKALTESERGYVHPSTMYTSQFHASQLECDSSSPSPAQDHQMKPTRRRAPKACGECRRLKLKCDRVFPCQSCVKRGCEGICPEGSLVSGRGSRYILANTEQLHDKIIQLTDRIRELEDALRATCEEHGRCVNPKSPPHDPPHPLLREDLLLIKNQLELYGLDRPQLASKSDGPYLSDGSDAEHSRIGNEQHHQYSPPEVLFPQSTAQFMEPQHARHVRGDDFNVASQTASDVPFMAPNWFANPHAVSQYGSEMDLVHHMPQAPYPCTMPCMAATDGQLQSYHERDSQLAPQSTMDMRALSRSGDTRYHSSIPFPQIQTSYYHSST